MPQCREKKCGEKLVWKTPYKKGDLPINPDGTKHTCRYKTKRSWKTNKYDYIHCPLCPEHYGWCLTDEASKLHPEMEQGDHPLQNHRKLWHPNDEKLTLDDFKVE